MLCFSLGATTRFRILILIDKIKLDISVSVYHNYTGSINQQTYLYNTEPYVSQ